MNTWHLLHLSFRTYDVLSPVPFPNPRTLFWWAVSWAAWTCFNTPTASQRAFLSLSSLTHPTPLSSRGRAGPLTSRSIGSPTTGWCKLWRYSASTAWDFFWEPSSRHHHAGCHEVFTFVFISRWVRKKHSQSLIGNLVVRRKKTALWSITKRTMVWERLAWGRHISWRTQTTSEQERQKLRGWKRASHNLTRLFWRRLMGSKVLQFDEKDFV